MKATIPAPQPEAPWAEAAAWDEAVGTAYLSEFASFEANVASRVRCLKHKLPEENDPDVQHTQIAYNASANARQDVMAALRLRLATLIEANEDLKEEGGTDDYGGAHRQDSGGDGEGESND